MKVDSVIKKLKEDNPEILILVQIGAFYHVYGKDAYIASYLFNYQMKNAEVNNNTCLISKRGIDKILKILEEQSISYTLLIKTQNYEVEKERDFKKKNKYMENYQKAYRYVSMKRRIDTIYNYLIENIDMAETRDKVQKIEEKLFHC